MSNSTRLMTMDGSSDSQACIDYMPGSELLDAFGDTLTEGSSSSSSEEEEEVAQPTIHPNKTPRISFPQQQQEEEEPQYQSSEEEEDEEDEDEDARPYRPVGTAKKIPYFPRITKQYKVNILKMLREKQMYESEERKFQKELLVFYQSHSRVLKLLPAQSRLEDEKGYMDPLKMNTSFLDYSKMAPLLYQGLLRFDTSEKNKLRIYSGERLILNIYVKV